MQVHKCVTHDSYQMDMTEKKQKREQNIEINFFFFLMKNIFARVLYFIESFTLLLETP